MRKFEISFFKKNEKGDNVYRRNIYLEACASLDHLNMFNTETFKAIIDSEVKINNEYDENGNLTKEQAYEVPEMSLIVQRSYEYNENNKCIRMNDDILNNTWKYEYDENGNCIHMYDTAGNEIIQTYDDHNVLISSFFNGCECKYEYDENGNIIRTKSDEGDMCEYEYDMNNRLISEKYNDDILHTYKYMDGIEITRSKDLIETYNIDIDKHPGLFALAKNG